MEKLWLLLGTLCSERACTKCDMTKALSLEQPAALRVTCWIDACSPLTFLPLHLPTPLLTDSSVYSVSNGPWPHTVTCCWCAFMQKYEHNFPANANKNGILKFIYFLLFLKNLFFLTMKHLNNLIVLDEGVFLFLAFLIIGFHSVTLTLDPTLPLLRCCFQVHTVLKVQSWLEKSVLLINNDAVSTWKWILELLRGTVVFQPWTIV